MLKLAESQYLSRMGLLDLYRFCRTIRHWSTLTSWPQYWRKVCAPGLPAPPEHVDFLYYFNRYWPVLAPFTLLGLAVRFSFYALRALLTR